jgi:hypothetical protein
MVGITVYFSIESPMCSHFCCNSSSEKRYASTAHLARHCKESMTMCSDWYVSYWSYIRRGLELMSRHSADNLLRFREF